MIEKIIGKKEKRTNKGTDMQYVADSLIHDTTYHTRCLCQISKILGQVVAEKSLSKKKFTHKHTHTNGKSKNYIPPIYFVYRGYNYFSLEQKTQNTVYAMHLSSVRHQIPRVAQGVVANLLNVQYVNTLVV